LDDFADSVFLNCMTNKNLVQGEKVVDLAAKYRVIKVKSRIFVKPLHLRKVNRKFFQTPPSNKSLDGPKTDPALPGIMFTFLLSYYPMFLLLL